MIGEDDLFEDGYDSDGKIGPFSDAILLEGEQDFDEDQLGTDAVCNDNNNDDGDSDSNSNGDGDSDNSTEEEEEVNDTENLNAIKSMALKTIKLELYLRLESSIGKKVKLQERLLEALRLKKRRYSSKAAVKAAKAAAKAAKTKSNKKQKKKRTTNTGGPKNQLDGLKTFHPNAH